MSLAVGPMKVLPQTSRGVAPEGDLGGGEGARHRAAGTQEVQEAVVRGGSFISRSTFLAGERV